MEIFIQKHHSELVSYKITLFWEAYKILSVALRAIHSSRTVAPLFLVYPSLKAGVMDPSTRTSASARVNPLGLPVVVFSCETNPTGPGIIKNLKLN